MAIKDYRILSRQSWGTDEPKINVSDIQVGALLRIADSLELMANNHDQLIRDRDYQKRRADDYRTACNRGRKQLSGLRGYIKKLKKGK